MLEIAWISPTTGVSPYVSQLLLPHLRQRYLIDEIDPLNINDTQRRKLLTQQYQRRIFQIEPGTALSKTLLLLQQVRGIAFFHQALLRPEDQLPGRDITDWASAVDAALFPYERDLREFVLRLQNRRCSRPKCYLLPYPVSEEAGEFTRSDDGFAVAVVGGPSVEYRLPTILNLAKTMTEVQWFWFVDNSERAAAQRLCDEWSVPHVELVEDTGLDSWERLLTKVDVSMHLAFSAYGNHGPFLPMSWNSGKATIVSDFAGGEDLPGDFVFKISVGQREQQELGEVLRYLRHDRRARAYGEQGCEYAHEYQRSSTIAAELAAIYR